MTVILCPGQGSQKPGFLRPWLDDSDARATLAELSDTADVDLLHAGTDADSDFIRDTAVAQPLIVAAGILSYRRIQTELGHRPNPAGAAGHSVGEITAAMVAGVFSERHALRLVAARGRAMAAAAAITPTGMSAVLGGDRDAVLTRIRALDLTPANVNGGGQVVAAGAISSLKELQNVPPAGARVIPLQVAGAFHSPYMSPAVETFTVVADAIPTQNPRIRLWSNRDGSELRTGRQVIENLVSQLVSPVRWDLCMAAMVEAGVKGVIELSPGGTLVGLAKRELPNVAAVALTTPEDLPRAAELLS